MRMLIVEVHVKPEALERYLEVVRDDALHSEQDEEGCLRFDVLRDNEDPCKFMYYEVYKDAEAQASHRETPHFKKYAEEVAPLLDREPVRHFVHNFLPSDADWR